MNSSLACPQIPLRAHDIKAAQSVCPERSKCAHNSASSVLAFSTRACVVWFHTSDGSKGIFDTLASVKTLSAFSRSFRVLALGIYLERLIFCCCYWPRTECCMVVYSHAGHPGSSSYIHIYTYIRTERVVIGDHGYG